MPRPQRRLPEMDLFDELLLERSTGFAKFPFPNYK
jgi:hypothetical protein